MRPRRSSVLSLSFRIQPHTHTHTQQTHKHTRALLQSVVHVFLIEKKTCHTSNTTRPFNHSSDASRTRFRTNRPNNRACFSSCFPILFSFFALSFPHTCVAFCLLSFFSKHAGASWRSDSFNQPHTHGCCFALMRVKVLIIYLGLQTVPARRGVRTPSLGAYLCASVFMRQCVRV